MPNHARKSVLAAQWPARIAQSQILTLTQTAEYLRISKAHLSNVIKGKVHTVPPLPHARVGRRILIQRVWVDEWLELAGQESVQE
jgi:excisionase family DNA binding protein